MNEAYTFYVVKYDKYLKSFIDYSAALFTAKDRSIRYGEAHLLVYETCGEITTYYRALIFKNGGVLNAISD